MGEAQASHTPPNASRLEPLKRRLQTLRVYCVLREPIRVLARPAGLEPAANRLAFHYDLRRRPSGRLWSGPSLDLVLPKEGLGPRRLASTPSQPRLSLARDCLSEVSPNLTGSTPTLSRGALQYATLTCNLKAVALSTELWADTFILLRSAALTPQDAKPHPLRGGHGSRSRWFGWGR